MALELLAGRWLAPWFGMTLTTWSWVIAVTLGAGALGAWLATQVRGRGVTTPLLLAAFVVAGDAVCAPRLVECAASLSDPWGAGAAAALVLLLPVLCASMVLPRLVVAAPGTTAGRLLASSTLGALLGTLASGLWAIPTLGLRATAFAVAGLLVVAALLALRRRGGALLLALLGAVGASLLPGDDAESGLIAARETLAGRVTLAREPAGLMLRVDGVLQGTSGVGLRDGAALVKAGQHLGALPYLRPTARTALVVGLGSGVLGNALDAHGITVRTFEVDPALADFAVQHLGARGEIVLGDARALWRRDPRTYDLIALDAFRGESLPSHLLTLEALRELAARLAPGGLLAIHLIGQPLDPAVASVSSTLRRALPHTLALCTAPLDELQDVVLVASGAPLFLPAHPDLLAAGLDARAAFTPSPDGPLLTDDLNPLDQLHEPHARALRARSTASRR